MIKLRDICRKILIVIFALFITMPVFAADEVGGLQSALPDQIIGDYGMWATEHNRREVTARITEELSHFGPTATTVSNAYVPIEAKIGLAFMGGMAKVGQALDSSLVSFAIMFMLIAYAFWVAFEAYNLIGSGADAKKVVKDIIIKGIWISVWLIILRIGIAETFAMIMMPIVSFGAFISNTIWDSMTHIAGISLPNTCEAIKIYAEQNTPECLNITAESAANLLCIPTQMSGFFVTTIGIGWKWVVGSVGFSFFAAVIGLYITYLSLKCIWKYLFFALGVIADLFLALLLLPFTAIAETTAKTQYKGVAGDIFNSFLGIFKTESLEVQINRFIQAALYFICLAISVGVSISLLSFIIDPNTGALLGGYSGFTGAVILVLTLLLVIYMADKSKSLAENWGGKIDSGLGDKLQGEVKKLWGGTKNLWKQVRGKK